VTRLLALVAGVAVLAGCSSQAAQELDGRTLFQQSCGACHSLADAGTEGTYGGDLERLRPTKAQVLAAIEHGKNEMPADLLVGPDADAVAAYVARAVRR
jgi:mono/diheme cytochrome c family protein